MRRSAENLSRSPAGDAAPAYRACLWEMHDQRNRRRIAELVGLLTVYGPAVQAERARYYQSNVVAAITQAR